jgi:hypothetical protein
MSGFARVAALVALVAALSSRAFAGALPAVHLDPARMFDPMAESLLADLFAPTHGALPVDAALFGDVNRTIAALPVPLPVPSGAAIVASVNLHAYTPPAALPAPPAQASSVATAMPAAPARAQLRAPAHVTITAPAVHFGSYSPYVPSAQRISENVQVPVRVGPVHFAGIVSSAQAQTERADAVRAMQLCGTTDEASACPYLHDEQTQNLTAGTNFNVRAGNKQVTFQLSGSVGRVTNRDAGMYQYAPLDPDTQLDAPAGPQDSPMLYYPGLSDVVRHGLNAGVAVPISPALTVGLQYNRAHYQGDYTALLAPGMDARKDTYLGNVTYQLPNSSSLITLSARQYRYQDTLAPNFNLTQTRADLSFTVKF